MIIIFFLLILINNPIILNYIMVAPIWWYIIIKLSSFPLLNADWSPTLATKIPQYLVLLKSLNCSPQALTNQILSNAHPRTPVSQYLFVNVIPYQNICVLMRQEITFMLFQKHSVFWESASICFSTLSLALCLNWNSRIYIKVICNMLELK